MGRLCTEQQGTAEQISASAPTATACAGPGEQQEAVGRRQEQGAEQVLRRKANVIWTAASRNARKCR